MNAIAHVVRGPTFDPLDFDVLHGTIRMLAASERPWMPCAEEHRNGQVDIRLSASLGGELTLTTLDQGCAEDTIEIPWNAGASRDAVDPDAAIRAVASYMRLVAERSDDSWLVDRWLLGTAALMADEGHAPIMVRLPGPHLGMCVLGARMQPVSSPLLDRIAAIAPRSLQAEMEETDSGGTIVWIQAAAGLCQSGERHSPTTDPVMSLRAAAFVRERLDAAR